MWNRRQGLAAARAAEDVLDGWYHVALAGGVLHRGKSAHDLDLIIYPRKKHAQNKNIARLRLAVLGWELVVTRERVVRQWRAAGGVPDTKHVEIWRDKQGRRIDLIFLS